MPFGGQPGAGGILGTGLGTVSNSWTAPPGSNPGSDTTGTQGMIDWVNSQLWGPTPGSPFTGGSTSGGGGTPTGGTGSSGFSSNVDLGGNMGLGGVVSLNQGAGVHLFGSGDPIEALRGPFGRGGGFGGGFGRRRPPTQPGAASVRPGFFGAQAVRPTNFGGFNPQYGQNLAAYAGGQFFRPQNVFQFNPFSAAPFTGQGFTGAGQVTGGGNAPIPGLPITMLQQAMQDWLMGTITPDTSPMQGSSFGKGLNWWEPPQVPVLSGV